MDELVLPATPYYSLVSVPADHPAVRVALPGFDPRLGSIRRRPMGILAGPDLADAHRIVAACRSLLDQIRS